jgi:hypothetical protein
VVVTFYVRKNYTGQRILYALKFVERAFRKAEVEGIAIVKPRGYKRIGKYNGRGGIKGGSYLTELSNVKEGCFAYRGNLLIMREVILKDEAQVACRVRMRNSGALEGD